MSETNVFQRRELQQHKDETHQDANHESPPRHNLLDLYQSAKETPIAPAINALAVEPVNIAIGAVNAVKQDAAFLVNRVFGSHVSAHETKSLQPLALAKAKEGSANYYSQKLFEGAGSLIAVVASGSTIGKVAHGASELRELGIGVRELHAGTALRSLAHDSQLLKKASVAGALIKETSTTPLAELLLHSKSLESPVARSFSIDQKALVDAFHHTHKLANLDGIALESRKTFDHPTVLTDPVMKGALVTSVTAYENGVKVYENPLGIIRNDNAGIYDNATRLTTDHETFMKKEWGGKVTLMDGVGAGATVDSVTELRSGGAAYVNEAGLYGPQSERVLLQDRNARVRLFDKADEVKAITGDGAVETNVQKIADTFGGTRANEHIERLLAQTALEDRPVAEAIMKASAPSIHGLALMTQLRGTAQEGKAWWQLNAPRRIAIDSVHPAADTSARAFSYLAGKSSTGLHAGDDVLKMYPRNSTPKALILFGDASKYSEEELGKLKELRASGTEMAIFDNSFDRSVNAVDLVKGTAKSKLDYLIDEVKAKQEATNSSHEEAVVAVIKGPAKNLADSLDAKLLGENLPTASVSRDELVRKMSDDFDQSFQFADDRAAASRAIAEIHFHDLPEMIEKLHTLHHFIEEASQSNALYVTKQGKSQALVNHFYKEVNDLSDSLFVNKGSLDSLPPDQLKGKSLVILDDAAYSGAQMSDEVDSVHFITKNQYPVIVGNLATYRKAYERVADKEGMQIVSVESAKPIYETSDDHSLSWQASHGVNGAGVVDSAQSTLTPAAVEAKRLSAFYDFNRGATFGQMGNRSIFFYKQADSTPQFIENFLQRHFGITQ